jgi:DNA-binding response OmpR family regulator
MDSSAPRILLVEDRSDLAAMYRLAFDVEGLETRVATTGTEGLAMAVSGWPQLILLDLQLPDMDGFAVFDAVRARRIDIPIVFLTVTEDDESIQRAMDLGAVDYLVKPRVKPSEVVHRIRHHLANGH